jgi:hypothetical protein
LSFFPQSNLFFSAAQKECTSTLRKITDDFQKKIKGSLAIALIGWGFSLVDMPIPNGPIISNALKPSVQKDSAAQDYALVIESDRSLCQSLAKSGVDSHVINKIKLSVPKKVEKSFRPGQKIQLVFNGNDLVSVKAYVGISRAWLIQRQSKGNWICRNIQSKVNCTYARLRLPVIDSMKKSLLSAGMDPVLTLEMARALGRSGISWGKLNGAIVDVMYQKLENSETKACALGHIAMIRIDQKNSSRTYYAHKITNKISRNAFYTLAGIGVGARMQSSGRVATWGKPVDRARITSHFGNRRHPIYGCTKFHKGLDFGGSKGSPIKAVGNGVVVAAKFDSAYGKYVKIQHSSGYQTLYAHLSSSAVRVGQKVCKGQTIGGMGNSGRTTGTHLHFEVLKNGSAIDPMGVMGSSKGYSGQSVGSVGFTRVQRKKFYDQVAILNKRYMALGGAMSTTALMRALKAAQSCGNQKSTTLSSRSVFNKKSHGRVIGFCKPVLSKKRGRKG